MKLQTILLLAGAAWLITKAVEKPAAVKPSAQTTKAAAGKTQIQNL